MLMAAAIDGLVKHNASISGAECGCQAEVGSAASRALRGDGVHLVSLVVCIETMRQTGPDIWGKYKETSMGGLAVNLPNGLADGAATVAVGGMSVSGWTPSSPPG